MKCRKQIEENTLPSMPSSHGDSNSLLTVIAGSYEGQLCGFSVTSVTGSSGASNSRSEGGSCAHTPMFAFSAHDGCIRSLRCSGAHLVAGSTDNTISVYNFKKKTECGKLLQQEGGGAINCLHFYAQSHMLSAGDQGEICIWRVNDWECLVRLQAHKAAVNDLSIHPSGRLALSAGNDSKLMLWNLMTGKCIYTATLPSGARLVRWTPRGDGYIVGGRKQLLLYGLDDASATPRSLVHDIQGGGAEAGAAAAAPTIIAAVFATDDLCVCGGEDGTLGVYSLAADGCVARVTAHNSRVKAVECAPAGGQKVEGDGAPLFVTASSNGEIKIWRLGGIGGTVTPEALHSIKTRLRITAMAVGPPEPPAAIAEPPNVNDDLADATKVKRAEGSHHGGRPQRKEGSHHGGRPVESSTAAAAKKKKNGGEGGGKAAPAKPKLKGVAKQSKTKKRASQ